MNQKACPYLTNAFHLLSRKWFGIILHTISLSGANGAHFTQLKARIPNITPRILSLRLNELQEEKLVEKIDTEQHHVYRLTDKGIDLVASLVSIEKWAHKYLEID